MKVKDANSVFEHAIVGGSEYGWQCWPHARWLDYESEYAHGSVVFSTATGILYEATVTPKDDANVAYRWVNPVWRTAMELEAERRGVDPSKAWDDVQWVDCEVEDDWADKARALWRGEQPDTRISVPLEIDDEVFMQLARAAHERDITLNAMVEELLRAEIDAHKMLHDRDGADEPIPPTVTEALSADDRSPSEIEHSSYWYDTDRNR